MCKKLKKEHDHQAADISLIPVIHQSEKRDYAVLEDKAEMLRKEVEMLHILVLS